MKSFDDLIWQTKVSPVQRLLMLALARRSERTNGVCTVSAQALAADLCVAVNTIWLNVADLESLGLLMVDRTGSGRARKNTYGLRLGNF